jgi:hypothetical protein
MPILMNMQIQHLSSVVAALAAAVAEDNGASGAHTARGLGEGMLPRASRTCAGVLAENHQAAPPVRGNAGPTAEERVAPGGGNGAGGNDGCDADNRLSTSDSDGIIPAPPAPSRARRCLLRLHPIYVTLGALKRLACFDM